MKNHSASSAKKHSAIAANEDKAAGKALVQVGAYTSEQQARSVQQKLAVAGINAHISQSQTSKGTLYRVRTGTYANRHQAQQGLSKVQGAGLDGLVIGQ